MWSVMETAEPNVFANDNDEGVERVIKDRRLYAFFMESTTIEYIAERKCEVKQVGGLLDSKSYGIATPPSKFYDLRKFIPLSKNIEYNYRLAISNVH